uniref:ATP-binding cassette sub-family C member 9-like n=1 Tax=Saccoglossus kowalevskii TaxID=10224 RepID=A0ABM0MJ58_SACKO|nr:PREDICTED: ATP-binding cassette sub-family C member 9-like [Saccoglossus kowalevskii]
MGTDGIYIDARSVQIFYSCVELTGGEGLSNIEHERIHRNTKQATRNLHPSNCGSCFVHSGDMWRFLCHEVYRANSLDKRQATDLKNFDTYFMKSHTNFLSCLTVWWANRLPFISNKIVNTSDLGSLPDEYSVQQILHIFNKAYKFEQEQAGDNQQPSLWKVYWRAHKFEIAAGIIARVLSFLLSIVPPLCLTGYTNYATEYYYNNVKKYYGVYERMLQLSRSSGQSLVGQTINMMSVDGIAIQWLFLFNNFIIAIPVQILAVSCVLIWHVGVAGILGVCIVVATLPLLFWISTMQSGSQKLCLSYSDIRLKMTNEVLQGMKLIKLCGWEDMFTSRMNEARQQEMKHKSNVGLHFLYATVVSQCAPIIVPVVIFAMHSYLETAPLTPDVVFSALALTNLLLHPLYFLPNLSKYVVEAVTSNTRVQSYLTLLNISRCRNESEVTLNDTEEDYIDEHYKMQNDMNTVNSRTPLTSFASTRNYSATSSCTSSRICYVQPDIAVEIINGTFSWTEDACESVLNNINVKIRTGSLNIIVGDVGSGKSSLLSAILGELYTVSGKIIFPGNDKSLAYVAQEGWLQNASLRDNILFGEEYLPERYDAVISVCALKFDLQNIPGDKKEIGEKGINISGGQKQRISLARALYSNVNTVLLDDPVSALDVHVAAHVMEKAILQFLLDEHRTVVLVTNQTEYLEHANQIIVLKNGFISYKGDLNELRTHETWQSLHHNVPRWRNKSKNNTKIRAVPPSAPNMATSNVNASLIVEEERKTGGVPWNVITSYAKAMKLSRVAVIVVCFVLQLAAVVINNLILSAWSTAGQESITGTQYEQDSLVDYYLPRYATVTIIIIVMTMLTNTFQAVFSLSAAKRLFMLMLHNVGHAPIRFFHTTPVGRILNRFSNDTMSVDLKLWIILNGMMSVGVQLTSTFLVNMIISPYLIIIMVLIVLTFSVYINRSVRLPR